VRCSSSVARLDQQLGLSGHGASDVPVVFGGVPEHASANSESRTEAKRRMEVRMRS
jgi:hypothetical protein